MNQQVSQVDDEEFQKVRTSVVKEVVPREREIAAGGVQKLIVGRELLRRARAGGSVL